MLSRNDDSTKTSASSTKPPIDAGGSTRGSASGTPLVLEVPREQREAGQQQAEVGDDHPLVREVRAQAGESRALAERADQHLVDRDDGRPVDGHAQRVVMEERDAGSVSAKSTKVDRNHVAQRLRARHRPGGQVCDYTHAGT